MAAGTAVSLLTGVDSVRARPSRDERRAMAAGTAVSLLMGVNSVRARPVRHERRAMAAGTAVSLLMGGDSVRARPMFLPKLPLPVATVLITTATPRQECCCHCPPSVTHSSSLAFRLDEISP